MESLKETQIVCAVEVTAQDDCGTKYVSTNRVEKENSKKDEDIENFNSKIVDR